MCFLFFIIITYFLNIVEITYIMIWQLWFIYSRRYCIVIGNLWDAILNNQIVFINMSVMIVPFPSNWNYLCSKPLNLYYYFLCFAFGIHINLYHHRYILNCLHIYNYDNMDHLTVIVFIFSSIYESTYFIFCLCFLIIYNWLQQYSLYISRKYKLLWKYVS